MYCCCVYVCAARFSAIVTCVDEQTCDVKRTQSQVLVHTYLTTSHALPKSGVLLFPFSTDCPEVSMSRATVICQHRVAPQP